MIVDEKGSPVVPKPSKKYILFIRVKSLFKKGPAAFALLVTITALIVNFDSVINLYERFAKGPIFKIHVTVVNNTNGIIEIEPLLDFYITYSQFHTGRLMAGESPTGRIMLTNENQIFRIEPNKQNLYSAELKKRPYKSALESGGNSIIFVLRIQNSDIVYWSQQAFQADVMKNTSLKLEIKQ